MGDKSKRIVSSKPVWDTQQDPFQILNICVVHIALDARRKGSLLGLDGSHINVNQVSGLMEKPTEVNDKVILVSSSVNSDHHVPKNQVTDRALLFIPS